MSPSEKHPKGQIFCGSHPGKPILKKNKPTKIILDWDVCRLED